HRCVSQSSLSQATTDGAALELLCAAPGGGRLLLLMTHRHSLQSCESERPTEIMLRGMRALRFRVEKLPPHRYMYEHYLLRAAMETEGRQRYSKTQQLRICARLFELACHAGSDPINHSVAMSERFFCTQIFGATIGAATSATLKQAGNESPPSPRHLPQAGQAIMGHQRNVSPRMLFHRHQTQNREKDGEEGGRLRGVAFLTAWSSRCLSA
ncbi:unnamed protein product, partial [Pleuronectes platessa]